MGFFQIIYNFLGITPRDQKDIPKPADKSKSADEIDVQIQELDKTIKQLKARNKYTRTDNVDWDSLSHVPNDAPKTIYIFERYSFSEIVTLSFLKQERIRKEKERIEKLTLDTANAISTALSYVKHRDLNKANELESQIRKNMREVQDTAVKSKYNKFLSDLNKLREEIRKEEEERRLAELKRQEEERKRKEEEERKRREEEERRAADERKRQEHERQERERREAERLAEARRKEEAEMAEKRRLENINSNKKVEAEDILAYLRCNGIRKLYHFTDKRNLTSIRIRGGLLSCQYLNSKNISVPNMGGDYHAAFSDFSLKDYVRTSFCSNLPMAYKLWQRNNRQIELVLLEIDLEVATFEHTKFSDNNASASVCNFGDDLEFIQSNIDLAATKLSRCRSDDPDFGPRQAEVMVKTFIPIRYILNIDHPTTMHFG